MNLLLLFRERSACSTLAEGLFVCLFICLTWGLWGHVARDPALSGHSTPVCQPGPTAVSAAVPSSSWK